MLTPPSPSKLSFGCKVEEFDEIEYGSCETQEEMAIRKEKLKLKKKYPNQPELWGDEHAEELKQEIERYENELLNDLPF
jgi:hypothetical protein